MASRATYWASRDADPPDRSVITVQRSAADTYRITFGDVIGVVCVGDWIFEVRPKIPLPHAIYLLQRGNVLPRHSKDSAQLAEDASFWELVCHWFVTAMRQVVRTDLIRDYRERTETLAYVRGHIQPMRSSVAVLTGRMRLHCTFDEFDANTPLNRVIKAAGRHVAGSTLLSEALRRDAARLVASMDEVRNLEPQDLYATTDSRTRHYRDCHVLAKEVLRHQGRSLQMGDAPAWCYLMPTPLGIEQGLRNALAEELRSQIPVYKKGMRLGKTTLTLNPDLVFGVPPIAVGDVKYQIRGGQWSRQWIYQLTTFGSAYGVETAVVVNFATAKRQPLQPIDVGEVHLASLSYDAREAVTPRDAMRALSAECLQALAESSAP